MIDTLNLRLSNVKLYPLTKLIFEKTASKTGTTSFEVDEDTGEVYSSSQIRALMFHDSSTFIPLTKRDSLYIGSSHYTLSYKYNVREDCVDFDFSIPKYLYGTNILQFVKYFGQDYETQYNFLMSFIRSFIKKIAIEVVDMANVSITRIDLCYNQFFNSKFDAFKYLDEQKKLLSKYARSSRNGAVRYDESLTYVTKRYSFKIYHKGTEFRKNDMVKLADRNPTKEGLDNLASVADRILRYEITVRKAQIDYLFKQNKLYNKYLGFYYSESSRKSFRHLQPDFYKRCLKFAERGHNYVCSPVSQFEAIDTGNVFFSVDVFKLIYQFFWDYVAKFQMECKMSVYDVLKKIEAKNNDRDKLPVEFDKMRRKASHNRNMLVSMALLAQYYPLSELRKSNIIGRSQFYKYQSQLKELGLHEKGVLVDVPPPAIDYMEYLAIFGKHHSGVGLLKSSEPLTKK